MSVQDLGASSGFRRPFYSGLNLNQDKATKPQTVQIVRQGEATPYWFKFNPLYNAGELTVDELMKQIDDYMDYYNRERCSLKLKKLSPVAYRTQLAQSA